MLTIDLMRLVATPVNLKTSDKIKRSKHKKGYMVFSKVSFKVFAIFLCICSVLTSDFGDAHPGRTDANGGHYNRKTGEYHKHVKEDAQSAENDTDLVVSQDTLTSDANQSALKLAAWNIRILSDNSRNDSELHKIAQTLIDYDFIAISELRDEAVLKRTQKILSQMGEMYQYQLSPAVGRGVKERYAFLYKKDLVSVVRRGELYPDGADGKDDFARDPYWATFRAGAFDFSVIAVHVIWGDTVGPRKAEVSALADVYRYVQVVNGVEATFFSWETSTATRMTRNPTVKSWQSLRWFACSSSHRNHIFGTPVFTTTSFSRRIMAKNTSIDRGSTGSMKRILGTMTKPQTLP